MPANHRNRRGTRLEELLAPVAIGVVILGVMLVWAAVHLGEWTSQQPASRSNPFGLVFALLNRKVLWTTSDTVWVAVLVTALVVAVVAGGLLIAARRPLRQGIDASGRLLARDRGALKRYSDPSRGPASELGAGPVFGRDISSGKTIRATWEDVAVCIAGARMGKSTGWAVPAIISAPGPVYATSNKRDLVDMSRGIRESAGTVWVFDPQGIAATTPTWWWNPLDMATDVPGARTLAGLFAAASRPVGSSTDSYFDPEGEELLAMMLLAAGPTAGNVAITTVYTWLTSPALAAAAVPHLAKAGFALSAAGVQGVLSQPDKQRAGVFGTAKKMIGFLADRALAEWAIDPGDGLPRFSADQFVSSSDTLYSLSKEGPGSAGPLTAALTAAVVQSAERLASRSANGRLATPMVCVLDEVANVCRWRELPDLYSHYGSRGIVLLSFLQSWSQGVECWGREGMSKLWGAANIRVYGGGVSETEFLTMVSKVCGEVDLPTRSTSHSKNHDSISSSMRREPVFDVATLAALQPGRAVVMLSGAHPVLVAVEPCFKGPQAAGIAASVARYGTGATDTVETMEVVR